MGIKSSRFQRKALMELTPSPGSQSGHVSMPTNQKHGRSLQSRKWYSQETGMIFHGALGGGGDAATWG